MKKQNSEKIFLILSLITLLFGSFIYIKFSKAADVKSTDIQKVEKVTNSLKLSQAEKAIKEAQKSPSKETFEKAQKSLNDLHYSAQKVKLQKKLDIVKKAFSKEEAALKAIEESKKLPSLENKEKAQKAIDAVSNKDKKATLQAKLDAIFGETYQVPAPAAGLQSPDSATLNDASQAQNPAAQPSYQPPVANPASPAANQNSDTNKAADPGAGAGNNPSNP
ncbi:fibrinogen-binding protein [Streptococcus catagoni]|uniref:fibrinogen-binding protein n=1 Tax=Streptococcus catagoni TaxID=2654874 RepID=UPI001408E012|nr:fibrinogen-binding protein [Streptococcus catagoni]